MAQNQDINKEHVIIDQYGNHHMGGTKLHQAIARKDGKEIKKLLKQGADPNLFYKDKRGNSGHSFSKPPLITALRNINLPEIFLPYYYPANRTPNHEMVKDLLKAGADPNINHMGLKTNDPDIAEVRGLSTVESAAINDDHKSLAHLIEYGADIEIPTRRPGILGEDNPTMIRAMDEVRASRHNLNRAAKKIQNKFLDSRVDPNTRYGQLHIAEGYKAGHAAAAPAYSKVFDNSLKTMDQLIAASDRKKAFEKQAPRKITKARESPFGNRKKYSRKN